jgi:hypothetical protein
MWPIFSQRLLEAIRFSSLNGTCGSIFGTMTHCTHGAPGWPGAVDIGWIRAPQRAREDKRRIKEPERDLRRKYKTLAETAVLLVLSKQ